MQVPKPVALVTGVPDSLRSVQLCCVLNKHEERHAFEAIS